LVALSAELAHHVVWVLSVHIVDLRKTNLVSRVLVLEIFKVVFATPNDVHSIVLMSQVASHAIATDAHEIR